MADTTPERVWATAPHLKALDEATILIYIEDAKNYMQDYKIAAKDYELTQRLLTQHFASLSVRQASSEKVSDLSRSYKMEVGKGLASTPYGQQFLDIVRRCSGYLRII